MVSTFRWRMMMLDRWFMVHGVAGVIAQRVGKLEIGFEGEEDEVVVLKLLDAWATEAGRR